jgi:hypothetical protein
MSWLSENDNRRARRKTERPRLRTERLVTEDTGDELLVYDETTDEAHCLSRTAARIWRACDGAHSAGEIASALDTDIGTVRQALEEMDARGLLEPSSGITRREATLRAAKAGGAAAAAAPLIYSIIVPAAALAASQNFCTGLGCQSGCGHCKAAGCACCGPGGGNVKLCTADCSTANCSASIVNTFHCSTPVTSIVCNT